ncbi:uncharacterized protein LOC143215969 [Lasioglossum baleicum]|uniref:uncharacterized protein LOC143215969 n=1 Tax=Lasioglossum baleicum TaxID=434251 RepID=UPI003FCD3766
MRPANIYPLFQLIPTRCEPTDTNEDTRNPRRRNYTPSDAFDTSLPFFFQCSQSIIDLIIQQGQSKGKELPLLDTGFYAFMLSPWKFQEAEKLIFDICSTTHSSCVVPKLQVFE